MTDNFLKKYGGELIDRGYSIVPIAKGCKHPKGIKGWQNEHAGHKKLNEWIRMGFTGVGIQSSRTVGVDLDIRNVEVCDQIKKIVIDILGPSLERVGLAPKVLLPYRTETPFRKVQSPRFISPDGLIHKVEILGEGQQFVAYHVHPDTGEPYEWSYNGGHCEGIRLVDANTLPTISQEQAQNIVHAFMECMPSTWQEYKGEDDHPYLLHPQTDDWLDDTSRARAEQADHIHDHVPPPNGNGATPHDGDGFGDVKPKLNLTEEQVANALKDVNANDYEVWIKVGMALYHQSDGDVWGHELWDAWSATSNNYSPELVKEKWHTFNADDNRNPVTFASVLSMGKQTRVDRNPEAEFLRNYVYVEEGDCVVDLSRAACSPPIEMKSFRNATANIRMQIIVPAPTVAEPDRVREKVVPVWEQWLKNPQRQEAMSLCYEPGGPRLRKTDRGDGIQVNTFFMKEHPTGLGADMTIFDQHMKYLFPDDADREWFIDWLAYGLQHPGVRSKVTPLHIAVDHGTGRGWIVELIYKLVGNWNCAKTRMSTMSADGGYNEYIYNTLFCFIEEVHESDKRFGISDKVRDVLTDTNLEINLKYGKKGSCDVYTNFFLMSNHTDALVLKAEDRRIAVFRCDEGFKPGQYYSALYEWSADARNVGRLFHTLMKRDLSAFNSTRAPSTRAKQDMIGFNQTGVEGELMDFLSDHPEVEAAHLGMIVDYINKGREFGVEIVEKEKKQMVKILQQVGKKLGRHRHNGGAKYVWQLHNGKDIADTQMRASFELIEKITKERGNCVPCDSVLEDNWLDE